MSVAGAAHTRLVKGRRARVLSERLALHLPERASVLDVGCGDGGIARSILELRPDVSISGLEVLTRAESMIPIDLFDGRTLPRPDRSVDVVMFVDVLHHTRDQMALLREAARVARRSVLIKDHSVRGLLARPTLRAMDWFGNAHHGVDLPYDYWTEEEWAEGFRRAGLELESSEHRLGLYRPPVSWIFERSLHFMVRLRPVEGRAA